MVTLKKKRFVFTLTENYFGYKFKWSDLFLPASYNGLRKVVLGQPFLGVKIYTQTMVLFLNKPIEELFANFSSSHKRYIKKAEAEGVKCYHNKDRKAFVEFYNEFAKRKKLHTLDSKRLDECGGDEWIYFYAVKDDQLLVAHSYLQDEETGIVRLMQSGSLRLDENSDPGQIARANKLLHYYSIRHFKDSGHKEYDYGYSQSLPGLIEFKQSFGAKPIDEFNYFSYMYMLNKNHKKLLASLKCKRFLFKASTESN